MATSSGTGSGTGTGYGPTAKDLLAKAAASKEFADQLKDDPVAALSKEVANSPPEPLRSDKWIYRIVVIFLGLTTITAAVGGIIIGSQEKDVPEVLIALGSAAVGALAGLLTPSPGSAPNE